MKTTKFKPSEVGPIPVEWEVLKLGELFEFKNGYNTDAKNYGRGTPVASVLEALAERPLKASSIRGQVVAPQKDRESFSLKRGDLIFTRSSETLEDVGRSNVYDDDAAAMFGGFVIRGRAKTDNNSTCINLLLKTRGHRERVMSQGAGAQHYNIGQSGLERVLVTLPPRPEQEKIAEALSDVDALLAAMTTLIEKKRNVRIATACDLITGKVRLGAKADSYQNTEVGEIPSDWQMLPLGALFEFRQENNRDGSMKMILSVIKDVGVIPYAEKGNLGNRAKENTTQYNIARRGDIVMNSMNVIIGSVGVTKWDGCISPVYYALMPKDNADSNYYNAWFARSSTQARIKERACGMMEIRLKIGAKDLMEIRFPAPPVAEQRAIAAVLSDMDAEIAALESKRAKYESIKQGMMQELLTGKTRLA